MLGDASGIRDFFASGGPLYYISNNVDDPVVQAWRDLGFNEITFETLHLESSVDRWIRVEVDKEGVVQIDFSDYDRYLRTYLSNLGAKPFVYLGNIPRALSLRPEDPAYQTFQPKDWGQWQEFVKKIVMHNVRKFGLKGLDYGVLGEPDHPESWQGSGSGDPEKTLREHIELYAMTYRAVKAVDPAARVGGPATLSWKKTEWTEEASFFLEDWIHALGEFNKKESPGRRAGLDYVSWQDYGWAGENIREGADAVKAWLEKNGFDPETPKMLGGSGWGSWSANYMEESQTAYQRSSHVISNLISEFRDPNDRKISRALYYSFYFNEYWINPENRREMKMQQSVALVNIPVKGRYQLTAMYAAFQMAKELSSGQVLETKAEKPLEAMAVWDAARERLTVTVNNPSPEKAVAEIRVDDIPGQDPERVWTMKSIDEFHSIDGYGLEEGFELHPLVEGNMASVAILMRPYGVLQMSFAKPPPPPPPDEPEVADSEYLKPRSQGNASVQAPVIERKLPE